MENYELSSGDIKQIDWVTSQVKDGLNGIKSVVEQTTPTETSKETSTETPTETSKETSTETPTETSKETSKETSTETPTEISKETSTETPTEVAKETGDFFYEINNEKVILKMDIVKNYLEKIKDKERSDLKASNAAARIMAVQIAIRSPQIGGGNKDKYGDIIIDGILGPKTKGAVEKFQTEYGLKVDGLPGKETMNKMYDILIGKVQAGVGEQNQSDSENSDADSGKDDSGKDNSGKDNSGNDSNKNDITNNGETGNNREALENEPKDTDIVSVEKYIPSIKLDMRYATTNNFTGKQIYESADAKLRYGTIKKLKQAQDNLQSQGYSLKIWDAYRPQSAQEKLWSIRPDPALVANPKKGSAHTKGNTVDITLVKSDGTEIPMPSEFDDNNKKKIDRDYSDLSKEQMANAKILEGAMKKAGFSGYDKEWWHYSDSEDYPMEKGD